MESQNQSVDSRPTIKPTKTANKKCKHLPIIIILAILAAGGLGFGGFELWQNMQKDEEIRNLQAEKVESEDQKEDEEEKLISSSNYIYIGKWGMKLKLPDNIKNVSYKYSDHSSVLREAEISDDYSVLEIFGIPKDEEVAASVVDEYIYLMNGQGCFNVSISRNKFEGKYEYRVVGPQATCSNNDQLLELEGQATRIFTEYYRGNLESLMSSF